MMLAHCLAQGEVRMMAGDFWTLAESLYAGRH